MAIPILGRAPLVVPSAGQRHLRCGGCGGLDFGVHVEPLGSGRPERGATRAVAREVVCRTCRKVYQLRGDLAFERDGKDSNLRGDTRP